MNKQTRTQQFILEHLQHQLAGLWTKRYQIEFSNPCQCQLAHYILALIAVAAAGLLYEGVSRLLGYDGFPPFVLFYPVVMLTALLAGLWPGLLATAAATLLVGVFFLEPFFLEPRGQLPLASHAAAISLALFVGICVLLSFVAELFRQTRCRLRNAVAELDQTNTQLQHEIAKHQRAEQELWQSREQFRIMGEAVDYGVWMCNKEGGAEYVSDSFLKLLNMTLKENLQFGWTKRLPPEDVEPMMEKWLHCVRTGEMWDSEHRIIDHHGKIHTILTRGNPVRDEQWNITSWVGINLDITDRKQAENALEAERARLQAVLDSLPVAVWITDEKGSIIQSNKMVEQIWGEVPVSRDIDSYGEYKGWWADTGEPIEAEGWALARAVMKGEVSTGEIIDVQRFDGARATILNNASPVKDGEGRIMGGVAVAQDITELRTAEQELRQQAQLLDLSRDAIFTWELDGAIQYWNQGAEELYGYDQTEAIGHVSHELLKTTFPYGVVQLKTDLARDGQWRGELHHTSKDGRQLVVESRMVFIRHNEHSLVLESSRDVTERKRAEEALLQSEQRYKDLTESLEELVQKRTAALRQSEDQLRWLSSRLLRAQEDERKRIAMDLHDSIAASLAATKMKLELLGRRPEQDCDHFQTEIARAADLIHETNENVRQLMANLRPAMLDDLGLFPALRNHVRRFREQYPNIAVSMVAGFDEEAIPERLRIVLFRIAQEALTNIGKHSGATRADISLHKEGEGLCLE
ncbi:MAG TPA: PAS domain S-box protein, partial [Thermodesulfobacteriota bacterium]|nr:PAS domain S-box protein [Thermodesulfobacteriota bacterium]